MSSGKKRTATGATRSAAPAEDAPTKKKTAAAARAPKAQPHDGAKSPEDEAPKDGPTSGVTQTEAAAIAAIESKTRTRRHKKNYTFGIYNYRVLKQIFPDGVGISNKSMAILESFVEHMFVELATLAGQLARDNKRNTITTKDIQTALRLLLSDELARYAVSNGLAAVAAYKEATKPEDGLDTPTDKASAPAAIAAAQ